MAAPTTTPMTPDFEVKLLLNPSTALDPSTNQPVPSLLSIFSASSSPPIQMIVQFLDTPDTKEIYTAGWSPRIRRMADDPKKIELTYKKRYPVPLSLAPTIPSDPSVLKPNSDPDTPIGTFTNSIDAALAAGATDGFDASESSDYDAQVEWGYAKLTLSISRKKKEKAADWDLGPGTELPDGDKSRALLIGRAPGKFKNWGGVDGWGTEALKRSRIYGPVFAERWEGSWDGVDVDIEVWPVKKAGSGGGEEDGGVENIAEVSFKCDDAVVAKEKQGRLMEVLKEGGWFLEGDSLKTQIIIDRY